MVDELALGRRASVPSRSPAGLQASGEAFVNQICGAFQAYPCRLQALANLAQRQRLAQFRVVDSARSRAVDSAVSPSRLARAARVGNKKTSGPFQPTRAQYVCAVKHRVNSLPTLFGTIEESQKGGGIKLRGCMIGNAGRLVRSPRMARTRRC